LAAGVAYYYESAGRSEGQGPVEFDSGLHLVMGTFARIICIAEDANTAQNCVEGAIEQLERIEALMSVYKEDSELSEVNRLAYKRSVKVSKQVFEVLQKSVEYSRLSKGAFDVTVGPLVELWKQAEKSGKAANNKLIAKTKSKVGYDKLLLDAQEKSVRFGVKGMKLDLGGIAKGYAIDKAIEQLKRAGARGGMVDIGGDICCFGKASGKKEHWLIGMQDPGKAGEGAGGEVLLVLKLGDTSVATSGDYRRFAVIAGEKYGHIIDSQTGSSAKGLSSVTIIADDATKADALATAVSAMGAQAGLELIESLDGVEAILVPSPGGGDIIKSSGAGRYIVGKEADISGGKMVKKYEVERVETAIDLSGDWDGAAWGGVEAVELTNYMGDRPEHWPKTEAKVLYDDENIYVIFRVEDEYVRAIAKGFHGRVFEDSCVEFFFSPGQNIENGYFNVETNCGGAMLFYFQKKPRVDSVEVAVEDCRRVEIYHSQPEIVEPEKQQPTVWFIEYRLPLDILEKYRKVERPAPGVVWRANFYKCGDKTSRPHWLTWSNVDLPTPDFHQPTFFGTLEFK